MKCPQCQSENKDVLKSCRKCGANLQMPPLWLPSWRWHLRTLGVIYAVVIVAFFVAKSVLKPYVRNLPPEITPWLHEGKTPHGIR